MFCIVYVFTLCVMRWFAHLYVYLYSYCLCCDDDDALFIYVRWRKNSLSKVLFNHLLSPGRGEYQYLQAHIVFAFSSFTNLRHERWIEWDFEWWIWKIEKLLFIKVDYFPSCGCVLHQRIGRDVWHPDDEAVEMSLCIEKKTFELII